jgi:tetratricopeptide (TPR) repeat protein
VDEAFNPIAAALPRIVNRRVHEVDALETPREHAIRCLQSAQRLDAIRETIPRRRWREQVEAEWQSWRIALQWSLEKVGNILLGQRLVGALETAWWVLPDPDAQHWVRAASEAIDEMTPRNVRARLNLALARLRIQHNRFKSCHAAAERALAQARDVGDEVGIARAQFLAGHSLVVLGHLADGERLLESALVGFRRLGAPRSAGRTLASLALAREHANDILAACSLCGEAVETLRAVEGEDGEVDHVSYLAELEFRAGNAQEALRLVYDALGRHRKLNERLHVVVDLNNAAAYLLALDRYDEARKDADQALALAVEEKNALWIAIALQHLAAIDALQGGGQRAALLLGFVDARMAELEHQREHTEEQEYQRIVSILRSRLEGSRLDRLMADGRSLSEAQAIAELTESKSHLPTA